MATDVEESDMEEHEHPGPAKRQRTSYTTTLAKRLEESASCNKTSNPQEGEAEREADQDFDEVEKLAREKLHLWQECQLDTGFLDNTINDILDRYFLKDDTPFPVFGDNEMENRAVATAIVNRGLAHTASRHDLVPSDVCWSSNDSSDSSDASDRSLSHESLPSRSAISDPPSSTSTAAFPTRLRCWNDDQMDENARSLSHENVPSCSTIINPPNSTPASAVSAAAARYWNEDKMDETDREQDFLERAVAEAIKKKGLSALSVDYG